MSEDTCGLWWLPYIVAGSIAGAVLGVAGAELLWRRRHP